jgi:outer membrane lipase/esterase
MMSWDNRWRSCLGRVTAAMTCALLFASCGGGDQVDPFVPARILAFGDEHSVIVEESNSLGRKYTINFQAAATDPTVDCTQLPIWTQVVANHYGLPFTECRGTAATAPSQILAKPNARVAIDENNVASQIGTFLGDNNNRFTDGDLVTVMAGLHDILAIQRTIGTSKTLDSAKADAQAAGAALAAQVNRIVNAGGKVLIATVPRVGYTPQGRADTTLAAQLNELTDLFNNALRINLINDGRRIGLVLADQNIRTVVEAASINVTVPACNDTTLSNVTTCTSQTLVTGATATTHLWADQLHLSPVGHANIGSLAVARATGNPF